MAKNLVERLNDVSQQDKEKLIETLLQPIILPSRVDFFMDTKGGRHYTKEDLVENFIARHFDYRGIKLTGEDGGVLRNKTIYNAFNKEPLKGVGYGIANAKQFPINIQKRLSGLENLYLLAGIWAEKHECYDRESCKEKPRLAEHYTHRTAIELVGDLIQKGIRHMESVHDNVSRVTKNRKGDYVTAPELPYAAAIVQEAEQARAYVQREFSTFCFKMRMGIEEANHLLGENGGDGLFAGKGQSAHEAAIQKLRSLVAESMFPAEFLIKFRGAYGHIPAYNIDRHLK